jgi:hypothetical protein
VTTEPAVAFAGSASVVLTSAKGLTVMVTLDALLALLASAVVLVMLAVFVIETVWLRLLLALAMIVMVAVPTAKLATVPVKKALLVTKLRLPEPLMLALTRLTPAGMASVSVTLAAALGPALTTTKT